MSCKPSSNQGKIKDNDMFCGVVMLFGIQAKLIWHVLVATLGVIFFFEINIFKAAL